MLTFNQEPQFLLPSTLRGIYETLAKLEEMLERSSSVGVVGMGGIGKTTLVKALYCSKSKNMAFEARSILFDVYKEKSIVVLQQQLLKDIANAGDYNDSSPPRDKEQGKALLQKFLPRRRVLIILDDVGNGSVGALIPEGLKLHSGSKIILTSRNWSTLENHVGEKLDMQFLSSSEAMEVFCLHAFKRPSCPVEDLHDITNDIVATCGGLPLSLEVVGSFLFKKQEQSMNYWKGALQRLKEAKSLDGGENDRLWKTLKISFDDLDESNQGKFLDVCFFCSSICLNYVTQEMAITIWGHEGNAYVDLQNLVDRHLVFINEKGFLSMHDQLLAMGRNILKTCNKFKFTRISDECDGLRYEVFIAHGFINFDLFGRACAFQLLIDLR